MVRNSSTMLLLDLRGIFPSLSSSSSPSSLSVSSSSSFSSSSSSSLTSPSLISPSLPLHSPTYTVSTPSLSSEPPPQDTHPASGCVFLVQCDCCHGPLSSACISCSNHHLVCKKCINLEACCFHFIFFLVFT
jgi:hypothetical protein